MAEQKDFTCRCPVNKCSGIVSYIEEDRDEDSFYGCGEFGHIWYERQNLLRDIDKSVTQYAHRKLCYVWQEDRWSSGFPAKEPENILSLIEGEEEDGVGEYIRD